MVNLWQNICTLCTSKQMSRQHLRKHAKISDSVLREIESGRCNPQLHTLERIAGALNVPLAYLFVPELLQINERLK